MIAVCAKGFALDDVYYREGTIQGNLSSGTVGRGGVKELHALMLLFSYFYLNTFYKYCISLHFKLSLLKTIVDYNARMTSF